MHLFCLYRFGQHRIARFSEEFFAPRTKNPLTCLPKGLEFQSKRPRSHSPQTFVPFQFPVRLHYAMID